MENVFALVLAVLPTLLTLYAGRGGGLDARVLKQARADLETLALLKKGPARDELEKHADRAIGEVLALRATREERSLALGFSLLCYFTAGLTILASILGYIDSMTSNGQELYWTTGLLLVVGLLLTGAYMMLRHEASGHLWAFPEKFAAAFRRRPGKPKR